MVIPISTAVAGGLTISIKVIYEIVMGKYNKYKRKNEKDQQTNEFFDELYRKSFQDNVIKVNMNVYVIFSLNFWMKQKMKLQ